MNETIASMKKKLDIIENAHSSLSAKQQNEIEANLRQIDRDLRGCVLMCLAISRK